MSMNYLACAGHVVKASEMLPVVIDKGQDAKEYNDALQAKDCERLTEILEASGFTPNAFTVFYLNLEDYADDLDVEGQTVYVVFDDDELYIKHPTNTLYYLKKMQIHPQFQTWTRFD